MYHIDLLADCSERVPYNIPDFPAYARKAKLSVYKNMRAASHWHDDLEFGIALSGHMTYMINGTQIRIHSGEGIFINARQLHSNFSVDESDCTYICVLVHPSLLCAARYVNDEHITPLMKNDSFPFAVLRRPVSWQANLMEVIEDIEKTFSVDDKATALLVQSLSFKAAAILHRNMPPTEAGSVHIDRRVAALSKMIGFVQQHYEEKITLSDIASSGSISESTCCTIFKQQLHQTPMGYLSHYRVEKSMLLLDQPDLSVTDVALAVGFSSASYFTETFRKRVGLTPSAYRKRMA